MYVATQCVAALLAGVVARTVLGGGVGYPAMPSGGKAHTAWLAEFLGTFLLVSVVLQVATAAATKGNNFFGLAIGLTVMAMAIALGGVSGGAFNPAVGLLASLAPWPSAAALAIYFTACPAAGVLAGLLFPLLTVGGDKNASPQEDDALRSANEEELGQIVR